MLQKETVIPKSRTNQLRNVLREFAYAAPLARRSQSPLGTIGRLLTAFRERGPYRQAHKARTCACSLCLTE